MSQKWFSIKAKAASKTQAASAEIFIYSEIGESWWGESVSAKDFITQLNALDVDQLTVRINSYGGSVSDGIAIHNAIKRHKAHVTVAIDGVAMSIASLIAMAGDTVEMAENALLMIHAPWTWADGNAVQLREIADNLDTWAAAMASSYAAKTGKSYDDCLALLTDGQDHYFSALEAQAEGYVDTLTSALAVAASADKARARLKPFFADSAEPDADNAPESATDPDPADPADPPAPAAPADTETAGSDNTIAAIVGEISASATLASQIEAIAKAAGVSQHLQAFLLDPQITDATSAAATIAQAREIASLCQSVGQPDQAAALIQQRADYAQARVILTNAKAEASSNETKNHTPEKTPETSKALWQKATAGLNKSNPRQTKE